MFKITKKAQATNVLFAILLLYIVFAVEVDLIFKGIIVFVLFFIIRDIYKEFRTVITLKGDRLLVTYGKKIDKEIMYRDMRYLTLTRKNRKWIVIADDEKILFTIRPRIENYQEMVNQLIRLNKSNSKLEVHETIKKLYKK